jgi:hypothetical protein
MKPATRILATSSLILSAALALSAQGVQHVNAGADPKTPWIQKGYKAPLNAWGQPDLEGIWTSASPVPLQRPNNLGDKAYYTPEEYAARRKGAEQAANGNAPTQAGTQADVHYDMSQYGLVSGFNVPDLRTSLITSPATGKIPQQTAAAAKRNAERNAYRQAHATDSTEFRSLSERCILWGSEVPPILHQGYNPNLQIVQSKDSVAITQEMIHDTRIIDLTRKTHLPPSLQQLFGDSIGHFEGDTLVIDTTNYTDRTAFQGSGTRLHVVERLRRTSPNDIEYSFTVEDPDTWDQPWSALVPWPRSESQTMFEYDCHEGNYGMPNILSGFRASEAKAPASKK